MSRKNKYGQELLLEFTLDGVAYLYAGLTDHDQSFESDMTEITDMNTPADAKAFMVGRMNHSLDVNALHKPGTDELEDTKMLDFYTSLIAQKAKTLITVKRGGKAVGDYFITATYYIKSTKEGAKDGEAISESISLQGTGDFEIGTVA